MGFRDEYNTNEARVDGLTVRAATHADVPALAELHRQRHGSDPEETVTHIRAHLDEIANGLQFAVCVAELEGSIVGYGMVGHRKMDALGARNLPDGLYLAGVYTQPTYRRRGIGHQLTLYRTQWAEGQADRLYYYTHMDNEASIKLHQAMGFREISRDFDVPPDIPDIKENQVLFEKRFQ